MVKLLHFADAHIDMSNYGRHDPESGLPMRVIDFLKSLDTIVDAAITEKVDLVIFAGDAYKDRNPAPTFQREWDRRMMRLSAAGIPSVLLVGNHDMSPSLGRAHALTELKTLEVPYLHVIDEPTFLSPDDLDGAPVQILAIPWITRSGMLAHLDFRPNEPGKIFEELEARLTALIHNWLEKADPALPTILAAHATIQGAKYGGERTVMLGGDLVLSGGLVRNPQLDYVALGHIHKPQDLNEGEQPPVIYPGSIERVDFGEAQDKKYYVIATLEKGQPTQVEWCELTGIRKFVDCYKKLESDQDVTASIASVFPKTAAMTDAIVRLVLEYPRQWEPLIDEAALRELTATAFEFHLVKRPQMEARIRIPENQSVGSLSPAELLTLYWDAAHTDPAEAEELLVLGKDVIDKVHGAGE